MGVGLVTQRAVAQPANDECIDAIPVIEGQFTFDLAEATNSVLSACDDPFGSPMPDRWWDYTASGTGSAVINTCGLVSSFFSTSVAAYSDCLGTEITCNSGSCGEGQSTVAFPVIAGHHYYIRIASADGQFATGEFSITLVSQCIAPAPGAPANDCCSTATPVGNGTFAFTTVGATRDYAGPCDQINPNPDVWFDYTAPTTGFSKVRPDVDAPVDLGVTILDGCGGAQIACGGDFILVGDVRQVVFPTEAGHHYRIRLHGVSDPVAAGHVVFATALPPVNDECINAIQVAGFGTFPYDNTLANNSGPDDDPACDFQFQGFPTPGIGHDVWFRWTNPLPADNDVVFSTCQSVPVDTKMAVYADGCPVGSPIACNDDTCFLWAEVTFTPVPGATYLIRIGVWPGAGNEPPPDGRPNRFTISSHPTCHVTAPPGAFIEPEPCGETLNDGFDFDCQTTGQFTDIPCGTTTIFGTAPVLGDIPDQDMYRVTLTAPTHVVFKGTAEFPMLLAILGTDCPQSLYVRWIFPSHPCDDPELNPLETDLDPGTYAFAVANRSAASACSGKNNYVVTISIGPTCPGRKGDFNLDNMVNAADVPAFVSALVHGPANPTIACQADMNEDSAVNGLDIPAFVAKVLDPSACP